MSVELRDYQKEAVERIQTAIESGTPRRLLAVSPTGSGKTIIAADVMHKLYWAGKTQWFIAPRRELIHQTASKLKLYDVPHSVIMAGDPRQNLYLRTQLASFDTLIARMVKRDKLGMLMKPDVIWVDECHLAIAPTRLKLLEMFPDSAIVGLTATPVLSSGMGLGAGYDEMYEVTTPAELTERGYLVPARYYAPTLPDLTNVRVTAGEYNAKDVDDVMEPLLGDIVEHWMKYAPTRRTVVFCNSVHQSAWLAQEFRKHGVAAEHCDGSFPNEEREAVFERFREGDTQVMTNVNLATFGFDLPTLDCVVMARPTKSVGLFLQMGGRGLRTAEGKDDCLVLDHAGNCLEHGLFTDERAWSLNGIRPKKARARAKPEAKAPKAINCPECKSVFQGSLKCPSCGHFLETIAKAFKVVKGELVPLKDDEIEATVEARRDFYLQLRGYAEKVGYKPMWCVHVFNEKFKRSPPWDWNRLPAKEPGTDVMRFLKYLQIRKAKAKEAATRRAQQPLAWSR